MVKLPASLVLADAATPVLSLTARTSAPGIAAPLESLTRPRIVPRGSCAKQGDRKAAARTRADGKLLGAKNMRNSFSSAAHCSSNHLKWELAKRLLGRCFRHLDTISYHAQVPDISGDCLGRDAVRRSRRSKGRGV